MQFAHSGTESEKAFTAPRTTLQRRTGPTSKRRTCTVLWCGAHAIHSAAPMAPDPHRPTALRPCLTTLPNPTPSRSVASVPRSTATSSYLPQCRPGFTLPGTALELSRKPKTENRSKLQLFAIADCHKAPNRRLRLENAAKTAHLCFAGIEKDPQSQKSCRKVENFVFAMS